jgi:hypothetical protein
MAQKKLQKDSKYDTFDLDGDGTAIIPDSRVKALADLLGLFYIGQASVVGAYMGFTAYMSRK